MVELELVAHLQLQFAALHMPLSCVEQGSVSRQGVVLRKHQFVQQEVSTVCTGSSTADYSTLVQY
jgi:hypothetical protein